MQTLIKLLNIENCTKIYFKYSNITKCFEHLDKPNNKLIILGEILFFKALRI